MKILNWTSYLALSAMIAAPAAAEELKYTNSSGGSVKLYGQLSPSYIWIDDGGETTGKFVDNDSSNSRVGLWVEQPFDAGTLTFNFESALGFRFSDGINQLDDGSSWHWDRTRLRKVDFAFASNSWGKLSFGQGSMATDGVTQFDFNNNGMTNYAGITDPNGGFLFRRKDGTLSSVSISDAASGLDGGRRGRVRYDTPAFANFTLSVAAGQEVLSETNDDNYYDVALTYDREFEAFNVKGGIGYSHRDRDNDPDDKDTSGSLSVLHKASGISVTVAGGSRHDGGSYWYGKLGSDADIWDIGTTSLAADYYDGSDFVSDGSDTKIYGFGINQDLDQYNTQIYAGYRSIDFDERGEDYQDIDSYILGARWKF